MSPVHTRSCWLIGKYRVLGRAERAERAEQAEVAETSWPAGDPKAAC